MAAAGAWASALGEAILGANKGYQVSKQQDFENKRQIAADQRAQQELEMQQKLHALQMAITQNQLADKPKKDAQDVMETLLKLSPQGAYDNPAFLKAAQTAGTPIPTNPNFNPQNIVKQRMSAVESGQPVLPPTVNDQATTMGVAPTTGAMLPPELLTQLKKRTEADQAEKDLLSSFPPGAPQHTAIQYEIATGHPLPTAANPPKPTNDWVIEKRTDPLDGSESFIRIDKSTGKSEPIQGAGGGGNSSPVAKPNDFLTGDALLKTLDPKTAMMVKKMSDYSAILPTAGRVLDSPYWKNLFDLAYQFDPSFDQSQYKARQALRTSYTSGPESNNIRALNAAIGHVGSLKQDAEALHNRQIPFIGSTWNYLANALAERSGKGQAQKAFRTTSTAVETELARFLKGTGATDQEIAQWRQNLSGDQSNPEFDSTFNAILDVIDKQAQAIKTKYDAGMGKPGAFDPYDQKTKDLIESIRGNKAAAAPPATSNIKSITPYTGP